MDSKSAGILAFSIVLCLLLSQAAAVSAAISYPIKTVAPVKVITNTTVVTTTNKTLDTTTTTTKTNTYDSSGKIVSYTENVTSSTSPVKTTTTTHYTTYNNMGQIDTETAYDRETGTYTDSGGLKANLATVSSGVSDVLTTIPPAVQDPYINLVCPENQTYDIDWPDEPYDFSIGDCDSLGKEGEVEEYIQDIYDIAKACYDYTGTALDEMYDQRDEIVEYIEGCSNTPDPADLDPSLMHGVEPCMPLFSTCWSSSGAHGGYEETPDGFAYTHLLESMQEAVEKTCERAHVINEDLVCLCEDVAGYINGDEWLYYGHKQQLIHMFESYHLNEYYVYHSPNVTLNWLLYLNNSWHSYYNPDYIDCSPDLEMFSRPYSAMHALEGAKIAMGSGFLGQASVRVEVDEDGFKYQLEDEQTLDAENESDEILVFAPSSGKMYIASKGIKDALKNESKVELKAKEKVRVAVGKLTFTHMPPDPLDFDDGVKATTKETVQLKNGKMYLDNGKVAVSVSPMGAASAFIEGMEDESGKVMVNGHDWDSVKKGTGATYEGVDGESTDESHETGTEIVSLELVMQGDQPEYLVSVKQPARLFGFIPVTMASTAHVNAQTGNLGQTETPWWSFLAAK